MILKQIKEKIRFLSALEYMSKHFLRPKERVEEAETVLVSKIRLHLPVSEEQAREMIKIYKEKD